MALTFVGSSRRPGSNTQEVPQRPVTTMESVQRSTWTGQGRRATTARRIMHRMAFACFPRSQTRDPAEGGGRQATSISRELLFCLASTGGWERCWALARTGFGVLMGTACTPRCRILDKATGGGQESGSGMRVHISMGSRTTQRGRPRVSPSRRRLEAMA